MRTVQSSLLLVGWNNYVVHLGPHKELHVCMVSMSPLLKYKEIDMFSVQVFYVMITYYSYFVNHAF